MNNNPKIWQDAELTILNELFADSTPAELEAALPGRTIEAIRTRAKKQGLFRTSKLRFTPAEDERIRADYPTGDTAVLAAELGRGAKAIADRASVLGVSKTKEALAAIQRRNRVTLPVQTRIPRTGTPKKPGQRKVAKAEPKQVVKPWQYPMNSPEYKAWEASLLEGRTRTAILDSNGKVAHVYRKNS